jgi:TatD DNase family protein
VLSECSQRGLRRNVPCVGGSWEFFARVNTFGDSSVGIGGVVTFKNASLAETVRKIPLEKIVLETDCPYLAPVPYRGKRNESAYIPLIAEKIALQKGIDIEEVEAVTTANAQKLFGI